MPSANLHRTGLDSGIRHATVVDSADIAASVHHRSPPDFRPIAADPVEAAAAGTVAVAETCIRPGFAGRHIVVEMRDTGGGHTGCDSDLGGSHIDLEREAEVRSLREQEIRTEKVEGAHLQSQERTRIQTVRSPDDRSCSCFGRTDQT